jgi:hypothetical protein
LPKVSGFTDAAGVQHLPGDIVDLPKSYKGETWLKIVEETEKAPTPSAKTEEAGKPKKPAEIQLEPKKPKRKAK